MDNFLTMGAYNAQANDEEPTLSLDELLKGPTASPNDKYKLGNLDLTKKHTRKQLEQGLESEATSQYADLGTIKRLYQDYCCFERGKAHKVVQHAVEIYNAVPEEKKEAEGYMLYWEHEGDPQPEKIPIKFENTTEQTAIIQAFLEKNPTRTITQTLFKPSPNLTLKPSTDGLTPELEDTFAALTQAHIQAQAFAHHTLLKHLNTQYNLSDEGLKKIKTWLQQGNDTNLELDGADYADGMPEPSPTILKRYHDACNNITLSGNAYTPPTDKPPPEETKVFVRLKKDLDAMFSGQRLLRGDITQDQARLIAISCDLDETEASAVAQYINAHIKNSQSTKDKSELCTVKQKPEGKITIDHNTQCITYSQLKTFQALKSGPYQQLHDNWKQEYDETLASTRGELEEYITTNISTTASPRSSFNSSRASSPIPTTPPNRTVSRVQKAAHKLESTLQDVPRSPSPSSRSSTATPGPSSHRSSSPSPTPR